MWENLNIVGTIIASVSLVSLWFAWKWGKVWWSGMRHKPRQVTVAEFRIIPEGTGQSDATVEESIAQPKVPTEDVVSEIEEGGYLALKIRPDKMEFVRIDQPCGNLFTFDTSMPKSGTGYLIKQRSLKDKTIVSYDPLKTPLISNESPQRAYRATNWPVLCRVYITNKDIWETVSKIMGYCALAAAFILAMIVVGK